jgi:hypothetical protein
MFGLLYRIALSLISNGIINGAAIAEMFLYFIPLSNQYKGGRSVKLDVCVFPVRGLNLISCLLVL